MNSERPLDQVSSIKTKLAVLVAASVVITAILALIGDRAGVPVWVTVPVTLGFALAVTYWLARGMTAPLREMTEAASAMAGGDYTLTVSSTGTDEVGALARAFTTMARDLAATDQQRRELISTVSHELRTPLAAQRAVLENLVDGVTPPSEATLAVALTQTERLSDLVEDLLDLSRLESGSTPLDVTDIDLAELVGSATREASLSGRDVTFRITTPSGMRVRADRARLTQVLANLLDNAVRHSPAGGVVAVRAQSSGSSWQLDVIDQGAGVDPALAGRIFERFSTGSEHSGGTGLGLAIARWICTLHGGEITIVPSVSGAHVRVALPTDPSVPSHLSLESAMPTPPTMPAEPAGPTPSTGLAEPTAPAAGPTQPTASQDLAAAAPTGAAAPPRAVVPAPYLPPPKAVGADPWFSGLWPERVSDPQPVALFGSLAIGALAGLLAFDRNLGLIVFVVLLLGGVLVWRASAYRFSRLTMVSAGLAVVLGSVVVWRAAEWLGVLSLLLTGVVIAMALTRAMKVSGIVTAVVSWPLSGIRGLPLLGKTLTATSKQGMVWPVVRTAAFSLVALLLFGGLFASADAIFGSWANAVVPNLEWDSITARIFILVMVGGVTLAGCYLALNPPKVDHVLRPATKKVRVWEWAVPVGLVIALFAGFLIAQASATIRGHEWVQSQAGLSYAEYVHQGFGQLTFATMLMLVAVALTLRKASTQTAQDRLWLRIMLSTLCVLTLAVVASALWRMHLYQQAYGFTSLRLMVDGFELWLGVVVLMVLASLVPLSTRWLGRAALLSGAAMMIGLVVMNPDAWSARHNIDRFAATGQLDANYLATLSDDAVPTIAASSLPDDLKACVLHVHPYQSPLSVTSADHDADDWLEFNLGRSRAVDARASVAPPSDPSSCSTFYADDVEYTSTR